MKNKMKLRIKKKLLKKQQTKESGITDTPDCKSTLCKVLATKEELEYLGCDLELTGHLVEYIRDYKSGYSEIRTKNEEMSAYFEKPIYEHYDIPKYLLEFQQGYHL